MKLYRSFVVRCWQEVSAESLVWRFALVEVGQAEQPRGFAEFDHLIAYLSERLDADANSLRTDENHRGVAERD